MASLTEKTRIPSYEELLIEELDDLFREEHELRRRLFGVHARIAKAQAELAPRMIARAAA